MAKSAFPPAAPVFVESKAGRFIKRLFLCLKSLNMAFSGVLPVARWGYSSWAASFLTFGSGT